MLPKPFDDLENVNKVLKLYKVDLVPAKEIAKIMKCRYPTILQVLRYHRVKLRRGFFAGMKNKKAFTPRPIGKYDHLIFEEINQGKDYIEYTKKLSK